MIKVGNLRQVVLVFKDGSIREQNISNTLHLEPGGKDSLKEDNLCKVRLLRVHLDNGGEGEEL